MREITLVLPLASSLWFAEMRYYGVAFFSFWIVPKDCHGQDKFGSGTHRERIHTMWRFSLFGHGDINDRKSSFRNSNAPREICTILVSKLSLDEYVCTFSFEAGLKVFKCLNTAPSVVPSWTKPLTLSPQSHIWRLAYRSTAKTMRST